MEATRKNRTGKKGKKKSGKKLNGAKKRSLGKDFFDVSKVMPRIDNKPPAFDIDTYYKPQSLEADAQAMVKIDAENMELLKKINTIHRIGGRVDCWNREFNNKKPEGEKDESAKIIEENKEIMMKIEQASGLYSTAELMRQWKKSQSAKKASKSISTKSSKHSKKHSKKSQKLQTPRESIGTTGTRCFLTIEVEATRRSLGKLVFQLFDDVAPKTCENFRSFCAGFDGMSYVKTPFHHIVAGYWCQGGDVTKFNGSGGTSIYGDKFEDENFTMKHFKRGILSTCSYEKDSCTSNINLTFRRLESMDGKKVVFGKLISGFRALDELERFGTKNGRPVMKIVVSKCGVL